MRMPIPVLDAVIAVALIGLGASCTALWYQYHPEHRSTVRTVQYRLLGDVNHDGIVNRVDTGIITSNWGKENPTYEDGDLNADGVIDDSDLSIVLKWQGNGKPNIILI